MDEFTKESIEVADFTSRLNKFGNQEEAEEWDEIAKDAKTPFGIISAQEVLETQYPSENWLIDKFLPEESLTLIVGEAGTFKSFLSLYIAKCLSTQESFLGNFETKRKCKILILDKENKLRRVQKRMKGLGFPLESEVYFLAYPEQFLFKPDNQSFKDVQAFVKENSIDVVILDSFIDMFEGNENSSTDTAIAFNAIRSISKKCTYIILHHDSKPVPMSTRSAAQKTRGSSNIIAQVDYQYYLEKGKDMVTFTVEQGKARDDEPISKFIVEVATDPEIGVTGFGYGGAFSTELSKVDGAATFVERYLIFSPYKSRKEILAAGQEEGITPASVKRAMEMMRDKKILASQPDESNKTRKLFYIVSVDETDVETKEFGQLEVYLDD